jgi:hypothetical protein
MRRLRLIAIVVAILFLCCLVIHFTKEPSYQGRTLTEWLQTGEKGERLGPTSPHYYQLVTKTVVPIQTIGTNGIPTLLRLIQAYDSKARRTFISWLDRQRWTTLRPLPDWEKQNMGVRGFGLLGTNALSAVPALIQLTHNGEGDVAFTAGYVLFLVLDSFRRDKDISLPVLRQLLNDSDPVMQLNAANTMAVWFPEEAEKADVYHKFPQLRSSSVQTASTANK